MSALRSQVLFLLAHSIRGYRNWGEIITGEVSGLVLSDFKTNLQIDNSSYETHSFTESVSVSFVNPD